MAGMLVVLAGPGSLSMKKRNSWNIPVSWQIGLDRVCFSGWIIATSLTRALLVYCFFCDDRNALFLFFLFFPCVTGSGFGGFGLIFYILFLAFWGNLCLDMIQLINWTIGDAFT